MTRMISTAGILAFGALMIFAAAGRADQKFSQIGQPPALPAPANSAQAIRWHYEWQYHYDRHGQWAPGWVAVLDSGR